MAVGKFLTSSSLALASLAATALFGAGFAMTASSETVLRNSFSVALNSAVTETPVTRQKLARGVPVAGTEDFWLTAMRPEGSLPVTKTVAVGDRMVLSFRGKDIEMEVAGVSAFSPGVSEIGTGASQTRFVLVTARDTSNKDARPVRFVMEVEHGPADTVAAKTARTL